MSTSATLTGGRLDRLQRPITLGFFVLLLAVGLATFRDYGVSWDEPEYYEYGDLVSDFYTSGDRTFETFSNLRFYGPAAALLHAGAADVAGVSPGFTVAFAHLINFFIFVGGVYALYRLLLLQTGRWGWSLFGSALLVLSPRIYSHAFVNPKDGPFLALFLISVYLLVRFLETRRTRTLVLLGLASAALVDIRVVGLLMVGLVLVCLGVDSATTDEDAPLRRFVRDAWIYVGVTVPGVLLGWPYLWPDPIGRFSEAVGLMKNFTVGPQHSVFMGRVAELTETPWSYLPVWIGVTTPLPYLLLALLGLAAAVRLRPWTAIRARGKERYYLLYAAWLFGPALLVIVGRSPLYDEWRHMTFVYPAMIIFSVTGARAVADWLRAITRTGVLHAVFLVALGGVLLSVSLTMARQHPYQALYFSSLTGGTSGAEHEFELDYWGLSYKEGLSWLLDEEPTGSLDVYACTTPGLRTAPFIEDGERLRFVSLDDADFAVCAPRGLALTDDGRPDFLDSHPTMYAVTVDDVEILYVTDLRPG